MTFLQLLNQLSNCDVYEVYLWLMWLSDPKKLSCVECIKTRKQLSGRPPNCSLCIPASSLIKKYFKNSGKGDFSNDSNQQEKK